MPLNIDKCQVLTFSRKKDPLTYAYELSSRVLTRVISKKDLGVIFDSRLVFDLHIQRVVSSSLRMLGFIIRNTGGFTSIETVKTLYCAYVRSHLEYAAIAWNPYYEVYKTELERVQRRFLKYLYFKKYGLYPVRGYDQALLLREFDLRSLEHRRTLAIVTFLYKLCNGISDCPELSSMLDLHEQRESARVMRVFDCPRARTNLMFKSPLYGMTSTFNF